MLQALRGRELPAWLWFWLPPLFMLLVYATAIIDRPFHKRWFSSEEGAVEWITVLLLVPAIACGVRLWRARRVLGQPWLARWWLLLTCTCVYFAGEEISWGQKIFLWQTPEFIGAVNDQNETNLHNISSWFDQKPRLLFELWVVGGGLLWPAWRRMQGFTYTPGQAGWWFWPTGVCVPTAIMVELAMLPERIKDLFGLPPYAVETRYSENQEFYFSLYLFLYLASAWNRLRARRAR